MSLMSLGIEAVERGWAPETLTRLAIRGFCRGRLRTGEGEQDRQASFLRSLRRGPIALAPDKANDQHYELPPEFFEAVLGPRRKYSCCYWPDNASTLAQAEEAALELTCEHAELADGQRVLELGCGWGSLSLWMAERHPASRITAVSNSAAQRRYIERQAVSRGLENLSVVTADMNEFAPDLTPGERYDRVLSVEMFEHMRNLELLLDRIASWLSDDGKLFVHVFCHQRLAYPFEVAEASDWMGRHFFTGGMMPSLDLLRQFDRRLHVAREWTWNGRHYQRTAEAWLENLAAQRAEVLDIFRSVYGSRDARRWRQRWRMFFLSVAELFGYDSGDEWLVAHYLLERNIRDQRTD